MHPRDRRDQFEDSVDADVAGGRLGSYLRVRKVHSGTPPYKNVKSPGHHTSTPLTFTSLTDRRNLHQTSPSRRARRASIALTMHPRVRVNSRDLGGVSISQRGAGPPFSQGSSHAVEVPPVGKGASTRTINTYVRDFPERGSCSNIIRG